MNLVPMCGYQGGKRRYAEMIADRMLSLGAARFYDMGVGSGAVTLALVSRGVPPSAITAVDAGPWGLVWKAIGNGTFNTGRLMSMIDEVCAMEPSSVQAWAENTLAHAEPTPECFVLLQAASFGSAPVWRDGDSWRVGETGWRYCARGYWIPGPGSSETKPRGTIFSPRKIASAAEQIVASCRGLDGRCERAEDTEIDPESVVYIDPPYEGVWGYGHKMNWRSIVDRHRPVILSEGRRVEDADTSFEVAPRKEGSFKGKNRGRPGEWINVWNP